MRACSDCPVRARFSPMDTISYKEAAKDSGTAFPIGNGRLGAMVFGGIDSQVIALNEESLWSSPFIDRANRSCRKDFPLFCEPE